MKLLIVESPAKCKTIKKILGAGWEVAASYGHLRDLPKSEMGVEPPKFRPKYVIEDSRARATVAKLSKLARSADAVFLATDPDREGEAIAWHLSKALKLDTFHRATFNAITASAVQGAIANPRALDKNLVAAQEARRVIDRLVGYIVSPLLSRKLGDGLSAGRVQSPTLRLLTDLERRIEQFVPQSHFGARLIMGDWHAEWNFKNLLPEGEDLWMDRARALEASLVKSVTVQAARLTEASITPPAPFKTSTLQQAASAKLGLSTKETMQLAQKLYEAGAITYMRTDSTVLSDEGLHAIREWLAAAGHELPPQPNVTKNKAGAQEGHEAIRPTHIDVEDAGDDDNQRMLYKLIWQRAVASQMLPARFDVVELDLASKQLVRGETALYLARGRKRTFPGWQAITEDATKEANDDGADDEKDVMSNPVPTASIGDEFTVVEGKLLEKTTKPPRRHTEGTLTKALEDLGIGRPSTWSSILSTLVARGYVVVEKRKLRVTDLGKTVVDLLVKTQFAIMDLGYTKTMEKALDRVARGESQYLDVVTPSHDQVNADAARLNEAEIPDALRHDCPECGKPLRRIKNKAKQTFFWGCTGFPDCKKRMVDEGGKPTEPGVSADGEFHPCPSCEKPLVRRKGKYGYFWSCSAYPDCTQSMDDKRGKPVPKQVREVDESVLCPECESPMIKRRPRVRRDNSPEYFYGCTQYPSCDGIRFPEH